MLVRGVVRDRKNPRDGLEFYRCNVIRATVYALAVGFGSVESEVLVHAKTIILGLGCE